MYVCTCIFELCTDDNSVLFTPAIITDCAPLVVITDLYTTLKLIRTINQSHITLWAYTCTVEDKQKDVIYQLQQLEQLQHMHNYSKFICLVYI